MDSGISLFDEQLGGLYPGRLHLLTGGPGTGKTTACLQFLHAGLRKGEPVALLTMDRTSDLVSHAERIGLYLEEPLRSRQLLLLRFRASFTTMIERAGSPDPMIEALCGMLAEIRPVRLVVDPITPFLSDHSASGAALSALASVLEMLGMTTLLTYPGDVSNGGDLRLNTIIQRAALIIHLARGVRVNRIQVVQARTTPARPSTTSFILQAEIISPPKRTRIRQPKPSL